MTINERIKEIRKSKGLTLEKFADRLGVTKATISNIENGNRNASAQLIKSICREYSVDENWLKTGENSQGNLNERLKELRSNLGLSQEAFAEKIGLRQSSYSDIEIGRRKLTKRNFNLICKEFNVNEHWLMTGESSPDNLSMRIRELREYLNLTRKDFGEKLGMSADSINNIERGRIVIKDYVIKLISREFNVSEQWLKIGDGKMFYSENDRNTILCNLFLNEYDNPLFSKLKSIAVDIITVYSQLDPKSKQVIDDFIIKLKNEQNNNKND